MVDVLAMTQGIAGIASLAHMTSFIWTGPTFAGVRVRPFRRNCIVEILLDVGLEQIDGSPGFWELRCVA
jgi:hypothetical protein